MRRVQIQLDEQTYEALRRRAFAGRRSFSATVREILKGAVAIRKRPRVRLKDFPFVGAVSVKDPYVVSEEHDRALAEDRW